MPAATTPSVIPSMLSLHGLHCAAAVVVAGE